VFQWRRPYRNGALGVGQGGSSANLLPVLLSPECAGLPTADGHEGQESEVQTRTEEQSAAGSAAIHIELPGRALISGNSGADPILV
jgi:hypothetical protein